LSQAAIDNQNVRTSGDAHNILFMYFSKTHAHSSVNAYVDKLDTSASANVHAHSTHNTCHTKSTVLPIVCAKAGLT